MGNYTLIVLLIFISIISSTFAGSCCGGGASLPSLIIGDYQAQVGMSATNSAVKYTSDQYGDIHDTSSNQYEVNEIYTLLGGYQLSPNWQVGLTIPYKYNTKKTSARSEQSRGVGDIKISAAYEFLPELNFSYYRPRGFLFLEESLPTGRSTYQATEPMRTDSFGRGFYTTSMGLAFFKNIFQYDVLFMSEYHYSLKREFQTNLEVTPGSGFSSVINIGFSPAKTKFHFGIGSSYVYESKGRVKGDITSISSSKYTTDMNLNASYLFNGFSVMGQYSDQSFWGISKNSNLSKSLQLSLMKFFDL